MAGRFPNELLKKLLRLNISILTLFLFISCRQSFKHTERNVERSFYFWRSVFKLSPQEKAAFDSLNIKTLYVKLFDVDWDNNSRSAVPVAQLRAPDSSFLRTSGLNIVPVVFITNKCIYKIDSSQVNPLAEKIKNLVNDISTNCGIRHIAEIQIDCDWTGGTKNKYFTLLKELQRMSPEINFSATIRLHQIKYAGNTGVPPVKKGMLMCYNMGNLTDINTRNSILETREMKKYTGDLQNYPLPLDAAFPVFSWKVLFREKKYAGLLESLPDKCLAAPELFRKDGNRYSVVKDTLLYGYEFRKGDLLRDESLTLEEIKPAVELLNDKFPGKNIRIALYHSDTLILKKYSSHEMENIYDGMH